MLHSDKFSIYYAVADLTHAFKNWHLQSKYTLATTLEILESVNNYTSIGQSGQMLSLTLHR